MLGHRPIGSWEANQSSGLRWMEEVCVGVGEGEAQADSWIQCHHLQVQTPLKATPGKTSLPPWGTGPHALLSELELFTGSVCSL